KFRFSQSASREGEAAVAGSAVANTGRPGRLGVRSPGGRRWVAVQGVGTLRLVGQVLLVGAVCHFSTQFGFAVTAAPHHIAALWPTSAILFAVLVATPVRHWFAYTAPAYFSSVLLDARAGFPLATFLFLVAA